MRCQNGSKCGRQVRELTRFERIKNMSIDEMAKAFDEKGIYADEICGGLKCPYMDEHGDISDDVDCTNCIKNWLESEGEL